MRTTINFDGEIYYILNSALVEKVIVADEVMIPQRSTTIYAKEPSNAGQMYGFDNITLEIDGKYIPIGPAFWAYVSRKSVQIIETKCKNCKINHDIIGPTLVIIPQTSPSRNL